MPLKLTERVIITILNTLSTPFKCTGYLLFLVFSWKLKFLFFILVEYCPERNLKQVLNNALLKKY